MVQLASQGQGGQRAEAIAALATIKDASVEAVVREALKADDPTLQAAGARVAAARGLKTLLPGCGRRRSRGSRRGNTTRRLRSSRSVIAPAANASPRRSPAMSPIRACPRRGRCRSPATANRGSRAWKPLLANQDGLNRFIAAELLLPENRVAAMRVLHPATADPNPVIRAEAARILAESATTDLSQLRPFLADPAPRARLWAAKGVLAKTPAPAPAPAAAAPAARKPGAARR